MMSSAARSACLVISSSEIRLLLALARLLDDPLGLALGLGEHLLALLDDPPRLLDLLGDRGAHLIEDVVDLLLVHADLIGQRDRLGVMDEIVQFVDEYQNIHRRTSVSSAAEPFLQSRATSSGHQIVDVTAERGELLDTAGPKETVLRRGHQVNGLDIGRLACG